ncbi:hypothetical protein Purlil1_11554 [Purpureocillium lilacinum]|uniref:Uncharacterized protein n=1 Tax=Purpureocillium lilacinum TaxID=33203 RepID=A0ABR0BK51_PURLI|nr:hypothetical protein Purlil1_11554 [Purpureocillium lilacinum]
MESPRFYHDGETPLERISALEDRIASDDAGSGVRAGGDANGDIVVSVGSSEITAATCSWQCVVACVSPLHTHGKDKSKQKTKTKRSLRLTLIAVEEAGTGDDYAGIEAADVKGKMRASEGRTLRRCGMTAPASSSSTCGFCFWRRWGWGVGGAGGVFALRAALGMRLLVMGSWASGGAFPSGCAGEGGRPEVQVHTGYLADVLLRVALDVGAVGCAPAGRLWCTCRQVLAAYEIHGVTSSKLVLGYALRRAAWPHFAQPCRFSPVNNPPPPSSDPSIIGIFSAKKPQAVTIALSPTYRDGGNLGRRRRVKRRCRLLAGRRLEEERGLGRHAMDSKWGNRLAARAHFPEFCCAIRPGIDELPAGISTDWHLVRTPGADTWSTVLTRLLLNGLIRWQRCLPSSLNGSRFKKSRTTAQHLLRPRSRVCINLSGDCQLGIADSGRDYSENVFAIGTMRRGSCRGCHSAHFPGLARVADLLSTHDLLEDKRTIP